MSLPYIDYLPSHAESRLELRRVYLQFEQQNKSSNAMNPSPMQINQHRQLPSSLTPTQAITTLKLMAQASATNHAH